MTPFQWTEHIIKHKTHYSKFARDDWKDFNQFMINRILSMNPNYLEVVDYISGLKIDGNEKIYRVYCDIIPKSNKVFFSYIKSQAQNHNKELLKYISNYYLCGFNEASDYIDIMGEDEMKMLLEKYGLENKEINKLIKTKTKTK
jgi:hypothetical protein